MIFFKNVFCYASNNTNYGYNIACIPPTLMKAIQMYAFKIVLSCMLTHE